MAREELQTTDWMKLPALLQHAFFSDASEEVSKVRARLARLSEKLNDLNKSLKFEKVPASTNWKYWRVAAVDGSNSSSMSERLGGRFGTFTAGYIIFQGKDQVAEWYRSGRYSSVQMGDPDTSERVLALLRTKLEREVALEALKEDIDVLLIDGSFFGFAAQAAHIKNAFIDTNDYEVGIELTREIRDRTLQLLRSYRAFGIVKRTRVSAIDGWLFRHHGEDSLINANDKHILTALLPRGHYFTYGSLTEKAHDYNYYSGLRTAYRHLVKSEGQDVSMDRAFDRAVQSRRQNVKKYLEYGAHELILEMDRYFVKCSDSPPLLVESKAGVDALPVISYVNEFHNPATGLPWPIDLIDENVSIPRGFTKEFVDEVQAQLIADRDLKGKDHLLHFFSYLNPQKAED